MRSVTYAAAIREALAEELERDEQVFLIGEDIGESGGVFGVDRVLDTPISEEAIVGAGVGASLLGGRPVVEIMFSDFAALAMDMIANQAAKTHYMTGGRLNAPLTIRLVTGTAGATAAQHSQSLEAWFVHVPGLKCVAPSTPADAKALLKTAVRDPDPVCFFEHKLLYNRKGEIEDEVEPLAFGRSRVAREGTDVTVVSYLKTLHDALDAAELLESEGASLEKTGRLLIAHEAPVRGGFGAEIAAIAAEEMWETLRAPIVRVCGTNTPMPYAPELEGFVIPDARRIAQAARSLVGVGVA